MAQKFSIKSQQGFSAVLLVVLMGFLGTILLLKFPSEPKRMASPQAEVKIASDSAKTEAQQQQKLEKYLTVETALLGVSDNISLYFKDLDHGKEIGIEPSRSWIPASTIKAYVVLEAFRQRSLGLIDFNQEVTIKPENVVATELETDEFPRLREGTKATIKQLVEAMIIQSDNIAYNTLLDILDRRNINLALKNIGITETVVGEKLNLDEGQFQKDLQVLGRQPNTTTVKDLATFFDLLYSKEIANADEILAIFKRQKINTMIPALLPTGTVVAHKTGEWAPIFHDGGVIYKPDDPFILTIFTNSDDPRIVARIAEVAYFQTADSVGKLTAFKDVPTLASNTRIYLAQNPADSSVLAAEAPEKFPEVSASDLGITQKDLNVNQEQAKEFLGALITPGSLLYNVKRFFEESFTKNAQTNSSKVSNLITLSKNRLAEAKSLIGAGDFKTADAVLKESEDHLEKATEIAKTDSNKDLLLLQIKKTNDLHYSVLAERAQHVNNNQKEQFIDNVYNFYKENHQKVAPVINTSVAANPVQQKPALGTITEIKDNQAKIQFDDGTSKEMIIPADTKVRNFHENSYTSTATIKPGETVAIVGLTNSEAKIIPQFILKKIPKELPQRHQGTVIEIKPDDNTMKILDKKGQEELIKVNFDTIIKSKDTNVSLEGIKAGSQVTVFGTNSLTSITPSPSSQLSPTPNASSVSPSATPPTTTLFPSSSSTSQTKSIQLISPSPTSVSLPTAKSSSSPAIKITNPLPTTKSIPANTNAPKGTTNTPKSPPTQSNQTTTTKEPIGIQATSVTVTQNSSGKQEKIEVKQEAPKKETPKSSPTTKK